jgi:hypothetical protein
VGGNGKDFMFYCYELRVVSAIIQTSGLKREVGVSGFFMVHSLDDKLLFSSIWDWCYILLWNFTKVDCYISMVDDLALPSLFG